MQKHFSTDWNKPLEVVIYPVNFDRHNETKKYISQLSVSDFSALDKFTRRQASQWGLELSEPTHTRLGDEILTLPPSPPSLDASLLSVMLWSLQFRYWAWVHTPDDESNYLRVRIFVLYQHAEKGDSIDHSIGLSKGLMAYVNAFASEGQTKQNNIVIMHELLHTVGATDKYDANGEPIFPLGYASVSEPLFPQKQAEIMAGRAALSPSESFMPDSLSGVVVGEETAKEIRWIDENPGPAY